jgi:outer membrane protein TolC
VLVGYDFTRPISTVELSLAIPVDGEVDRFASDDIPRRPEFAQFAAERRAEQQDVLVARADRRPQLLYTINGGLDSDSIRQPRLHEHIGASGAFNLTVPIFDWGAARSRERQARIRAQLGETTRTQQLRGFTQQFYAARTQALTAAARIRLAGTGIIQAESNLSASIARYRAGEATIIEVTDAQTTLAAQRLAFYQAIFDYQSARSRLAQAVGQ